MLPIAPIRLVAPGIRCEGTVVSFSSLGNGHIGDPTALHLGNPTSRITSSEVHTFFVFLPGTWLPCSYFCSGLAAALISTCIGWVTSTSGHKRQMSTRTSQFFYLVMSCLIQPCTNRESTLMRRKLSICPHYAIGDKASVHGIRCRGRVVPTGTCMC